MQGVPVAIGTGRVTGTDNGVGATGVKYQHHRGQMEFGTGSSGSSGSGGSGSGGSSPESQTQFYDGFGLGRV